MTYTTQNSTNFYKRSYRALMLAGIGLLAFNNAIAASELSASASSDGTEDRTAVHPTSSPSHAILDISKPEGISTPERLKQAGVADTFESDEGGLASAPSTTSSPSRNKPDVTFTREMIRLALLGTLPDSTLPPKIYKKHAREFLEGIGFDASPENINKLDGYKHILETLTTELEKAATVAAEPASAPSATEIVDALGISPRTAERTREALKAAHIDTSASEAALGTIASTLHIAPTDLEEAKRLAGGSTGVIEALATAPGTVDTTSGAPAPAAPTVVTVDATGSSIQSLPISSGSLAGSTSRSTKASAPSPTAASSHVPAPVPSNPTAAGVVVTSHPAPAGTSPSARVLDITTLPAPTASVPAPMPSSPASTGGSTSTSATGGSTSTSATGGAMSLAGAVTTSASAPISYTIDKDLPADLRSFARREATAVLNAVFDENAFLTYAMELSGKNVEDLNSDDLIRARRRLQE